MTPKVMTRHSRDDREADDTTTEKVREGKKREEYAKHECFEETNVFNECLRRN